MLSSIILSNLNIPDHQLIGTKFVAVTKKPPELGLGTKHRECDEVAEIFPCLRVEDAIDLVGMKALVLNTMVIYIIIKLEVVVYIG